MRKASPKRIYLILSTFFVLIASAAHGQLSWESTEIKKELELGQEKAEAVFKFENKGRYPVTIRSTSTSCGCTAASPTQDTFHPGDEGEIRAEFTVGNRIGTRNNRIQVFTDDPRSPQQTLSFKAEIPEFVTIEPRMVHWRAGDSDDRTRTVTVDLNPEAGLEVTGVEVENDLFAAEIEELDEPHRFLVKLTPREINSRGRAIISLQTEPKLENQRNFSFYAYVR